MKASILIFVDTFLHILVYRRSNKSPKDNTCERLTLVSIICRYVTDSGIVMVDGTFFGGSFEQDRSWDDSGTTISGI